MRQPRPTFRRSRVKAHWRFRTMTESGRLAFRRRNRLRCSCWALAWRVYRSFAVASRNLTSTVFAFQGRRVIAGSFFCVPSLDRTGYHEKGQKVWSRFTRRTQVRLCRFLPEFPATRRCIDLLRPVSLPGSRFTTDSVQRSVADILCQTPCRCPKLDRLPASPKVYSTMRPPCIHDSMSSGN